MATSDAAVRSHIRRTRLLRPGHRQHLPLPARNLFAAEPAAFAAGLFSATDRYAAHSRLVGRSIRQSAGRRKCWSSLNPSWATRPVNLALKVPANRGFYPLVQYPERISCRTDGMAGFARVCQQRPPFGPARQYAGQCCDGARRASWDGTIRIEPDAISLRGGDAISPLGAAVVQSVACDRPTIHNHPPPPLVPNARQQLDQMFARVARSGSDRHSSLRGMNRAAVLGLPKSAPTSSFENGGRATCFPVVTSIGACRCRKSHPGWRGCSDGLPSRWDDRPLEAAWRVPRRTVQITGGPRAEWHSSASNCSC